MSIPTVPSFTSTGTGTGTLTQHALLVLWGQFAQYLALPQAFAELPLHQKTYTHSPQTKLLEFLVATLAGLPHLVDISHAAHPLDQDCAVAAAWTQPGWADASGVCRSLQALSGAEAEQVAGLLSTISRPFIDQEVLLAMRSHGRLVYDGDLTGRPVSNTSTTYPGAAYGHMSDSVQLGYQAAMVSMHSPTYGRLWLGVTPHPGNTLSFGQAEALVRAAEAQTGVRPLRRVELLSARVAEIEQQRERRASQLSRAQEVLSDVERERVSTQRELWYWQGQAAELQAEYGPGGRAERPHSKLNRARSRAAVQEKRLPKLDKRLVQVKQWVAEAEGRLARVSSEQGRLEARLEELEGDNATNHSPIEAEFRLDGGFGTGENLAKLIELGYEVYTKPYSAQVTERLREGVNEQTEWTKVGGNAEVVGIASLMVHDCPYPLDGALERFYTGESVRYGTLVHYGRDRVLDELAGWFWEYNGRQTIEAGIKEGKGVFQMHHLKVRSLPALYLQEQFAVFAANFVRWAGHWLVTNCQQMGLVSGQRLVLGGNGRSGVKRQVQVGAHTSAWVSQQGGSWVLEFTDQSVYAGSAIRTREWVFQLPLPLFRNYDFVPI